MLMRPLRPLGVPNLALTAMVTREGQLASVQVIHHGVPDAALTRAVSRLASDVRFEPARAREAPASLLNEKKGARGQHVPRRLINIRTSHSPREWTAASTRARSCRGRQAARRSQTTP